jgi:hypothetical protein
VHSTCARTREAETRRRRCAGYRLLVIVYGICLLARGCLGVRAARCVLAQGVPLERREPRDGKSKSQDRTAHCQSNLILYTRNRHTAPRHSCHAHSVRVPQARVGAGARCGERARWLRPGTPWWDGVCFLVVLVVFLLQSV